MIRTLRGAWSRRGTLLPLLLLTVVVVAGAVSVIGFAGAADTSPMLAVPLLLLGAVAVPATGRELAIARRGEIALARLRGLEGRALYTLLAVEPLIVLLIGGLFGLALGAIGGWLAARSWVDVSAAPVGMSGVLVGLAIVGVGLVAVLVGMAGALREPLNNQVSIASRPRQATTAATFGSVLLIMAAVVAVYRSSVSSVSSASGSSGSDPDWLVLAGPALVGLAVGQIVVWLMRLLARLAVGRTASASLPGFLAVRRLARLADAATSLRVLVAAAVMAALALTGATQVDDWTDDTARLQAGAPLQIELDEDAHGALELTRRLDPDGRWLMAAVLVPGQGSLQARRAFVDTERYRAVVGDFLSHTGAADVGRRIAALGGSDSSLATGNTVRATVRGVSRRLAGAIRPRVTVVFLNERGRSDTVTIRLRVGLDGAPTTAEEALKGCSKGCVVTGLTLDRSPGDAMLPWILTGLDVAGVDALAREWRAAFTSQPQGVVQTAIVSVDDGLLRPAVAEPLEAVPVGGAAPLPVLATDSVTWAPEAPYVDSPGSDRRPAEVLDRLPALPLVEADGLLADLSRASAGAPPTVPAAEVMVLARADTPPEVLSALTDIAGHPARTQAQLDRVITDETGAAQARVYSLIAVFCLIVALLVLLAAVARQRSAWLRDLAALRVIGVGTGQLRKAGRMEVLVLALAAVLATVAGAFLAVRLLLGNLPLVTVPVHAVPLETSVAPGPVVIAAGVIALVVLIVAGRGRALGAELSRPAILREEGGP